MGSQRSFMAHSMVTVPLYSASLKQAQILRLRATSVEHSIALKNLPFFMLYMIVRPLGGYTVYMCV